MKAEPIIENQNAEVTPEQIELDVRRVMVRKSVVAPDIDEEWAKLQAMIHRGDNLDEGTDVHENNIVADVHENHAIADMHDNNSAADELENSPLSYIQQNRGIRGAGLICSFLAGVAATVLFFFVFSTGFDSHPANEVFTANENSKDILLSSEGGDMKVVNPGKTISFQTTDETAEVEMMTLSTPRGQDYCFILADGTKVWLNADSKIEFPKHFAGNTREVTLHGEAYFEVTKNPAKAFVVKSDYITTKVYGTSFNMRAYTKEDASVALITGSVAVKDNNSGYEAKIVPGQLARISDGEKSIDVKDVDTYPLIQWKDGFFYFDNNKLLDIMLEIGRWYNVSIIFEDENAINMNTHFHFVANRNESLKTVIESLNELGTVKVSLEGKQIVVK